MRQFQIIPLAIAAGLTFSNLIGCGGGAAEVPTITVKPAESSAGAGGGAPTTDGGTTPENGGSTDGYGTFKGKVVLAGSAPSLAPLVTMGKAARDPSVCAAKANIPDESLLVSDGGLANVFIYLKKAPKNGKDSIGENAAQELEFDQKGCIFIPHAMVVRTGKPIAVKNSDPVPHNVKTKPAVGQAYEATLNQGQLGELVYGRPEPVPVAAECNFHTWMKAYQLPLDHPYGVITKADGSFEITDLPVGTHNFVIWHERSTRPINSRFTVKIKSDGEVVEETISVDASKLAAVGGAKTKTIKLSFNR